MVATERDTDRIVEDHKDLVWHLVHRTVADREVHEDLFQEIFLGVLAGLPRFRGRSRLSTWIWSVALHTCLRHVNRSRRRPFLSLDEWLETTGAEPAGGEAPDPAAGEARAHLEAALARLPLKQRLPILLCHVEGLSQREVAAALDLPLGTVKTNVFRGLRRLREELGVNADAYL
ncbi:MAG: RNA polymerase sigma factor [Candidatus Krumholzibacteriota bacterium]|nr:RNA polymerase sigma factor [Candidatus Krumholzibacteriota bacterium]